MGKKKLDRAIELYRTTFPGSKDDSFTVSWHAFYLDPTSPKVGVPMMERMAQRFGAARLEAVNQRLKTIGRAEGIAFSFAGKLGNTRDSHRLVQLAKTKGDDVENRVVLELFRSYFEGTGDVTSHEMLADAAEKAGLDRAEAKSWLEEGKGGAEVDAEVAEAAARNIHGVPHFLIQGKYELGGAQNAEDILEQFAKVKSDESKTA